MLEEIETYWLYDAARIRSDYDIHHFNIRRIINTR